MNDHDIRVTVVSYPDRRHLMMRYVDPDTGKQVARSTGTTKRREAERAAARWEAELREGRYKKTIKISWDEFRDRYDKEKLSGLADNSRESADSALNHVETYLKPCRLSQVDATALSRLQGLLREEREIEETSIATHLRHIRAALSWAVEVGLLHEVPRINMPRRARGHRLMRGRPITEDEFARMRRVTIDVRPQDHLAWQLYLEGLWLSGLRLSESLVISWDRDAPLSVDLTGRRPRLRIWAEGEKGHLDRVLPMTPDFAQWLDQVPKRDRTGPLFVLNGLQTGKPMTEKRVGRVVSDIGKEADVLVNAAKQKFASAQDLRRSFGTRWAPRTKPTTLQLLMRHKSIETTLKYYVEQDADDVADELWREFETRRAI